MKWNEWLHNISILWDQVLGDTGSIWTTVKCISWWRISYQAKVISGSGWYGEQDGKTIMILTYTHVYNIQVSSSPEVLMFFGLRVWGCPRNLTSGELPDYETMMPRRQIRSIQPLVLGFESVYNKITSGPNYLERFKNLVDFMREPRKSMQLLKGYFTRFWCFENHGYKSNLVIWKLEHHGCKFKEPP